MSQHNHTNHTPKPRYGANKRPTAPHSEPTTAWNKGSVNSTTPHCQDKPYNQPAHTICKTHRGVWLPDEYIEQLLTTITANAKALNTVSQLFYNRCELVDFKPVGREEIHTLANQINDISMHVADIAMYVSEVTSE